MADHSDIPPSEPPQSGDVQVLARAARILRALDAQHNGLSLAELAGAVGLPRSSVHRIVSTLRTEGFLANVSDNGRVRLGPELMRLALGVRREVRQDLHPQIAALAANLQETVDLSVLDGAVMRFIDQVPSSRFLRAVSSVGAVFPLHCTANGKAVLAAMPEDDAVALLPPTLKRYTSVTITSRAELLRELDEIREQGYAYDREEHHEGITAIGVAIHDPIEPLLAISVPIPTQRFAAIEEHAVNALLETQRRCQDLRGT